MVGLYVDLSRGRHTYVACDSSDDGAIGFLNIETVRRNWFSARARLFYKGPNVGVGIAKIKISEI